MPLFDYFFIDAVCWPYCLHISTKIIKIANYYYKCQIIKLNLCHAFAITAVRRSTKTKDSATNAERKIPFLHLRPTVNRNNTVNPLPLPFRRHRRFLRPLPFLPPHRLKMCLQCRLSQFSSHRHTGLCRLLSNKRQFRLTDNRLLPQKKAASIRQ